MEGLVGIGMRMDTGAENVGSATAAVPNGAILVDESNDCFVPFSTSTAAFNRRQQSLQNCLTRGYRLDTAEAGHSPSASFLS